MNTRDMSQSQFDEAVSRHGFKCEGFMGYYKLPAPFQNCSVSVLNAGDNRRARLAYLLKELERHEKQEAA